MTASAAVLLVMSAVPASTQPSQQPRFLGREEILLYGLGLKVEPAHQTVPKDIATIVSTYLQAPTVPEGLSPFAPDAEIRATLRGPSFATPRELSIRPNTPFNVPPLTVPGTHTIENIRLISGGEVLLRGVPEQVTIEVIERLLITQVTARPLTAAEIREKGIVFDQSNFQAYNFTAAFAIQDQTIDLNFPVLLPNLQGAQDVQVGEARLPRIDPPPLPQLKTIIPDTLKLQTQIPNLSVVGFTLKAPSLQGGNLVVPPIPGVIVIPGDIGFLNQYFSVLLMVGNVAPDGSNLVVTDITAEIVLPPGRDNVVGTPDDPLRMAQTASGESQRIQIVVQPGPDGKLGTGDDIGSIGPGESGNAEYLVEGRREGSHVVEMEISATLNGLPVGPVEVRGRAAGAVLVRNPRFTLTFTHPEVVNAGEPYTLDITVTNTGESPANFVQLTLYPRNVSGATIVGDPMRSIESILPGDSSTVAFNLISRKTGRVTAATLDSDEKVAGRFELKTAIGELNIPLSPDSLVLPKEAASLPQDLRDAAIGLLGKAWAVATAPGAALPKDLRRFSRKIVFDRAVEIAEAGFRHTLGEPLEQSTAQLAMDFAGSNYGRLAELVKPTDLSFEQDNFLGFDELRRKSVRGDVFARAVAALLGDDLAAQGPTSWHFAVEQQWSYRPAHISVLAASAGPLPVELEIIDAAGLRVGTLGADGKILKEIAFSDLLPFSNAAGEITARMALLAAPEPGTYTIRLNRTGPADVPYTLSIVVPGGGGTLRQVVFGSISGDQRPVWTPLPDDPYLFTIELAAAGAPVEGVPAAAPMTQIVPDPAPSVISVVQQKEADQIRCDADSPGYPVGRVVAVLFSEEVSAASVQDKLKPEEITSFLPEANRAVGVSLQPGRRIAFVALRDPIGPFVPRQITIQDVKDLRGQAMAPFTGPMAITVDPTAGVVSGRVVRADGTPVPFASVRLFYLVQCDEPHWVGIASKSADAEGRYTWDYVLRPLTDRVVAVDPDTDEFRSVPFNIQRDGQRLNVDIVFLGRGSVTGTTRSEAGALLPGTTVRITSLTDNSQYGATTGANGQFSIDRVPVGNVFIEAVNVQHKAQFAFSELMPFAGAVVEREITLLDVEQRKIDVKHGLVKGRVLRTDGITPAPNVPVFVWYKHLSQPGVRCPGDPPPAECAIAGGQTAADGSFSFPDVASGELRVSSFDQDGLVQGEARLVLVPDGTVDLNVLLVGGLGTVTGRVLDPSGNPAAGATVGGGLSLVTANNNGEFTLTDVPVGKRQIVAVSELLHASGSVTIDLTRAGDTVNATIVLDAVGSVSGAVVHADGVTPAANVQVYVFEGKGQTVNVVGVGVTNAQGGYRIDGIRSGEYQVSSFNNDFTAGNLVPAVLKYHQQVFRADIKWRGSGGRVIGRVFDDDGQTPLRAMVSLSGDRPVIAGGRVGVAFQHVSHFAIAETDFTTGQYSLSGAWVGPVTVSAAGQFSPDPVAVTAEIPAPDTTIEVNLRLQPTSQIRGVVLQPDNVTPAGQNVIVRYKSDAFRVICTTNSLTGEDECDSIPQGIQEETVVTDEFGRFWLPIVNAGSFTISVEDPASGKVGQIKGAVRAGDTATVSVRLLGLGELTVRVRGSDTTTPIPGARVVVKQLNHPQKEVVGVADTDGVITFVGADGFSEGEFVIEATDLRNGFAGRGSARIESDGQQVAVNVYLYNAFGAVYGRVYASDGVTPVPNAEVVVSNPLGPLAFGLTEVDGTYRVTLVPLGDVRVEAFEARTARRAAGTGRVDVSGQEVPINLTQAALGVVKGRVLDSTSLSPLKGWTVTLAQHSSSGIALGSLQTTSAVDGAYMFPGTARGTFNLHARHADVSGGASASGSIGNEGEVVDVPLLVKAVRPLVGTIAGAVLTPTGAPAPNMVVTICHPTRPCENPVILTADGEGLFSLADAPLGRFTVNARSQTTHEAGSAQGELAFDGDIASVRVVMNGMSEVRGYVERSGGARAAGVRVALAGVPDAGCPGETCVVFADANGEFAFVNVPARTYTVTVIDPLNTAVKGAAGGALNPGEIAQLRIVLGPAHALSGRVMLPGNRVGVGIVAELVLAVDRRLYAESGADGIFTFPAVVPGTYQLLFADPIGSGVASRSVAVSADLNLGDVLLDTYPPVVSSSTPAAAATAVPREQAVVIVFSEPIRQGTIDASNVSLTGPSGAVAATLDVSNNDTVVTATPLAPLADETRYTLRVRGVQDRVGKTMAADYVATFTTVDITPVTIADASPAAGTGGAPIYTPIRIRYSETVDPSKFTGAPIALTGPVGAVAGRTDYLLGNSVIVFTPNLPLFEDAAYSVSIQRATDLAGNQQVSAVSYQFTTTDRTPPQIAGLTALNGGLVVENGIARVTADVGTTHDVAFVDWYINDVLSLADRSQPFELSFQANPNYGTPGSVIRVSAIATDTSGNRGSATSIDVTVTADQPPALQIVAPANGLAAHNGDRVVVRVRVTDDLGVERIGYRAETGRPTDTLTRPVEPPSLDRTEEFAFYVPTDTVPGASIAIQATAADTKGQVAQGAIAITVLDSVPPTVSITGATSGARVLPGQQTTVVVTAQDIGRVASVRFTASGLVTATETRAVDPAQPSIVTSFSVTVPTTAQPGQTVTLGAVATDVAGNSATAASVVLPVADTVAPTITLQPQAGHLNAVPGQSVNVIATAEDGIGLTRIDLATEGAVVFTDAKQVTPPTGSASLVFSIPVPASAMPGATITVRATAIDLSNNVSAPATITLTVVSAVTVVLPASDIIPAGESRDFAAQIDEAAPAGGLRIDFASDHVDIATATPFITVPEGQASATFTVSALSGGSTQIRALVQGVPRTAMTVTVQGGIVTGLVRDSQLIPVPGAQLTISGGGVQLDAVTDVDGRYRVDGVTGPEVDVRALDPVTRLYGRNTGTMARARGSVAVNVVLIPAASVKGVVFEADGTTPAPAGVRVDIFQAFGSTPLATTFTVDGGGYEFPLVTLGQYRLEASAVSGARARATVALGQTGQASTVNLVFLGSGTVTGVVRLNGVPVPNARLSFRAWSIFGAEPEIVRDGEADGTFTFTGVPVGSFSLVARDPSTSQAGSAGGDVRQHLETVTLEVNLANYAGVVGRVLRSDGTTVVAGAKVTISGSAYRQTETDADGRYRFEILPLGTYTLRASEEGTRGQAGGTVQLSTHGAMPTVDLSLLPQGRLLVTVTDAVGTPIPNALVTVSAVSGLFSDGIYATTLADGTILVEHVLAGSFTIVAKFGPLYGRTTGALASGELKPVTVALEPTASIAGTIFEADAQTPADGAFVRIDGTNISMTTDVTGAYRFDGLRLGQYGLLIDDQAGRRRAKTGQTSIVLSSNGQVVLRDFSFVGLGTVTGRVLNPDSSSAPTLPVTLRIQSPGFEQSRGTSTNAGGYYTFDDVPVGGFAVTVSAFAQQLYGEAAGTLAQHGDTAQADIVLTSNAVALPRTSHDANRFPYDVRANGAAEGGAGDIFAGGVTVDRGAWLLDVAVGGGSFVRFAGGEVPTAEDGGRETVVREENLGGMSVTRKAYVPRNGYFVRRLEVFRNPTALPITMDVQVVSNLNGQVGVNGTSSGDTTLGVTDAADPDRWLTIWRSALSQTGALGFVFDGQGGASRATTATLASVAGGQTHRQLALRWTSIVVPSGGTVALLHFGVQQFDDAAARASVERLVQLPPEALAGLSPEELAAIVNFVAPSDGVSTLAPLPSLVGTVTGRVLEGDGTTLVGGAAVRYRSAHPLFRGERVMTATAEGVFTLAGSLNDSGTSLPVPVFDYTVSATHPLTSIVSPSANGAFAPGATTAAADVVFTGSGLIAGTVRRHTGVAVSAGTVYLSGGTLGSGWLFVSLAGDSTFRFTGVPAGTYQLRALVPHAQGTGLAGLSSVLVAASETSDALVVIEPTGGVTGTVIAAGGAPAPNVDVRLARTDFLRTTRTDSGGAFTFADVPLGTFGVSAVEPASQIVTTAAANITQDQSSVVELRLIALGSVSAQVSYASGGPASGAVASLTYPTSVGTNGLRSGTTDATGTVTLADVPAGPFTITAHHPANSQIHVTATGTVPASGQTVAVPMLLPVAGSVDVRVQYSTAVDVPGATVRLTSGGVNRDATTDSTGRVTFAGVPAGAFSVTAYHPVNGTARATASGAIATDGLTVPVMVTLPVVGNVSVQVLRGAGTPVAGSSVRLDQSGLPQIARTSDSDGRVLFQAVPAGTFTIRAYHPENANLFGSTSGALATEGETLTLSVTLPAIGSVTGTVRMPDGTAVAGLAVSLRSSNPAMATLNTTTDASGVYQVNGVAAGAYTVTAENLAQGVWGTASGQILVDAATVTTDVQLQTNVVALATDRYDANNFRYDIQRNGSLSDGSSDAYDGGLNLQLVQGTSTSTFNGASTGLVEEAGREVVIRQNAILGLDVVRKIYVPSTGYFARYLEILTNPGTTPVTLSVRIATNLGSDSGTQLIATSSGDSTFAPDDDWLVTDDGSDGSGDPSLAHVMGGPGAATQLSAASLSYDNLAYAWNDVTIDPGQTVVLMHFAAQHFTRSQVRAAAERLVQLPAEALAGLSLDEISRIANFAVPADGSSTLPELRKPGTNGTVTGRVFAGDGQTAVGSAQVTLTSDNVFFGTSRSANAAADGTFTITGAMEDSFTMRARHPGTSVLSPVVSGAFEGGQTTATVNVTFSNTGVIRGFVRRHTGAAIAGAQISSPYYTTTAADGSFLLTGLLPGTHAVTVYVSHPQGGSEIASASVTAAAGETANQDIVLPPTGAIAGVVYTAAGAPAASVAVRLTNPSGGLNRSTTSNAQGQFLFTEVPVEVITVWAREPQSGFETNVQTTVVQDQTVTVDVTLTALGTVNGHITNPDGSPAENSYVQLSGSSISRSTYADASGLYEFAGVPVNTAFTVRVYPPNYWSAYQQSAPAQLTTNGETQTFDFIVPARATVRVHVQDTNGQPWPNRYVQLQRPGDGYFYSGGYTNAAGYVDFTSVIEGTVWLRSYFSATGYEYTSVIVTSADHGLIVEATLAAPRPMTIDGTVRAADGTTPLPGTYVYVMRRADRAYLRYAYTDASGAYTTGTFYSGTGDLIVRAESGNVFAEQDVTIPLGTTTASAHFILPVSVVRGRVTNADATGVPYPFVFATQMDASGVVQTYYSSFNDDLGNYLITGVQPGAFRVTAQDDDGLAAAADATLVDLLTPVTVDLQLPPTGSVTVTFVDAGGTPIGWQEITLSSPAHASLLYQWTDGQGRVTFPRVAVGAFVLEGCQWSTWFACASAAGEVTAAGQSVAVTLRFPRTGTVIARLVDETGAPVTDGSVAIEGITRRVETGSYGVDAQGRVRFDAIPEGTIRLIGRLWLPDETEVLGVVEGNVLAGATLTIDVPVGNAVSFTANLDGTDGFRYDVRCEGRLSDGGTTDRTETDAYDSAYYLGVDGASMPCVTAARTELGGRQLVLGPVMTMSSGGEGGSASAPFRVVRKIFVPDAGGFARYLELVTNVSASTRNVTVRVSGNYGPSASGVDVPVSPADTSNTYAIMAPATEWTAPVIGHVFAGPGAPVGVSRTSVATGSDEFSYEWSVSLAPGQTKGLMHFAIQRPMLGGASAADAQAQTLVALTDPLALEGLTPEESGLIVNFAGIAGSQPLSGSVAGAVFAADGATPIADATVYLFDVATGRELASARTDASGAYALGPVYTTAQGVRVTAVAPPDGVAAEQVVVFATDGESRLDINFTMPVPIISGAVLLSGGDPLPSPFVMLAVSGQAGPTRTATISRPDGTYVFIGAPVGQLVLTVLDAVSGLAARAPVNLPDATAVVTANLVLPALPACEAVPADLVTWWRAASLAADDAVHFGNDGTANGGVTYATGAIGDAFLFDGTTGRIDVPHRAELNPLSLTLEGWVRFTTLESLTANPDADQTIAFKRRGNTSEQAPEAYSLVKIRNWQGERFAFRMGQLGSSRVEVASTTLVQAGVFYHVAATYDAGVARLYVNGMLEGEEAVSMVPEPGAEPLSIGATGLGGLVEAPCNCAVDELKLYERALDATEIQGVYSALALGACQNLRMVSTVLPSLFEGQPYPGRVRAVGGAAPVTFTLATGAPATGLTFEPDGRFSGVPSAQGTFQFDVTVTDGLSAPQTATFVQECGAACFPQPPQVVSYFPADGTANDLVGSHHAWLAGTTYVPGVGGSAFQFDGIDDYVFSNTSPLLVADTFTMEFWVNPSATRATTTESTANLYGTAGHRFAIAPDYRCCNYVSSMAVSVGTNGVSVFEHDYYNGYSASTLVYETPIADWTHIAVVYQNRQPSLYVNGVFVRTGLVSLRTVYPSKTFGDLWNVGPYAGMLDEVAIYNRALSAAEIDAIFQAHGSVRCPVR